MIDLRSDTVTRPTSQMKAAMMAAEVGDDVFGEDPTVLRLQERVAELLGKEAALFVPSGTMSNQLALRCLTEHGDDVITDKTYHVYNYESGAGAVLSGVQFTPIDGKGGLPSADQVRAAIRPPAYWEPRTRVLWLENTANKAGGIVFSPADWAPLVDVARASGLALHLDGARLWNAAVALNQSEAELAAPFDTVSVCLSKGLGTPVGSVLAGSKALITRAHRLRKMWGGGMRQVGLLAAAGLYALDHHRERLAEDHANARFLAEGLSQLPAVSLNLDSVQSNIVMFSTPMDARLVQAALWERGVGVVPFGPFTLRATTHLDISQEDIERALRIFADVLPTLQ